MAQSVSVGKRDHPVGERIRVARIDAGLTVESLAQALGVSSRTVAGWQSGRSRPSYERLAEIGALLGKPPSFFLEAAA